MTRTKLPMYGEPIAARHPHRFAPCPPFIIFQISVAHPASEGASRGEDRVAMSFAKILSRTLVDVPGTLGWAFLADDGEIIVQDAQRGVESVPLLAAYHSITVGNYRRLGSLAAELGDIRSIVCGYEAGTCLLKLLKENYFIILVLAPDANLGFAMQFLDALTPRLNSEIG